MAASPILVVKSSRVKLLWLVVLFGCLLLMAMSALPSIAGWFATVILGLLFPVVLYIYRPSATFLRLHVNGLDISTAGRQRTIDWADVARFNIGANSGGKNIAIDYRHDLMIWNHPSRTPDADSEWIRDLYAMPLEQLCITLNCWRARRSSSAAHERGGISESLASSSPKCN
ncbi:hypothetical protein LP419_24490 [Massilia sp. H-1]|nr:hypothetical protein LP419_24490 [Massilia sp. H-1]